MTEKEAAIYIGMSRSFLRQGRMKSREATRILSPPYLKIGRTVRYTLQDLNEWIAQKRVDNHTES